MAHDHGHTEHKLAIFRGRLKARLNNKRNDHKHLRRAIYVNVIAHILFIGVLLGMYIWSGILTP